MKKKPVLTKPPKQGAWMKQIREGSRKLQSTQKRIKKNGRGS